MAELWIIRHGQASYGAADYDRLSQIGQHQSALLGAALRERGWVPDRVVTGTLRRQIETLKAMGFDGAAEAHAGFNEYDHADLLKSRLKDDGGPAQSQDRKAHFRLLRESVLAWQRDELEGATETWRVFTARVEAARRFATRPAAKRVLVVSSGGVIGQMVAASLAAPAAQMMQLNLQVKNASITRFVFTQGAFSLHEFNATPHLDRSDRAKFLTYS